MVAKNLWPTTIQKVLAAVCAVALAFSLSGSILAHLQHRAQVPTTLSTFDDGNFSSTSKFSSRLEERHKRKLFKYVCVFHVRMNL